MSRSLRRSLHSPPTSFLACCSPLPSPASAIQFLDIREVPIEPSILLDGQLAHAPYFIEAGISHDYRFLRTDCPKRTCGMDSGETNNGGRSPITSQRLSNWAWTIGLAKWA